MKRLLLAAGLLCEFLFFLPAPLFSAPDPEHIPVRFDGIIEKACALYRVDPVLVKAVLFQESRFNPRARGSMGEIGLMQLRPCVAKDWAKAHCARVPETEELFDPYLNIMIGVWKIHCALEHWRGRRDAVQLALFEYNAGRARLLTLIAHCGGDTSAVLRRGPSAAYVKSVRAIAASLRPGVFSTGRVVLSSN